MLEEMNWLESQAPKPIEAPKTTPTVQIKEEKNAGKAGKKGGKVG